MVDNRGFVFKMGGIRSCIFQEKTRVGCGGVSKYTLGLVFFFLRLAGFYIILMYTKF